jgi:hypothetical protein
MRPMLTTKLMVRVVMALSCLALVGCKDSPTKPAGTGGTGGASGGTGGTTGGRGGAGGTGGTAGRGTGGTAGSAGTGGTAGSGGSAGSGTDAAATETGGDAAVDGTSGDGSSDGTVDRMVDTSTDVTTDLAGDLPVPAATMSFFVTSTGSGAMGGNLGGLVGADAKCEALAAAVGAGGKGWKAFLSTNASGGTAAVNGKDRIGAGPWFNQKGVMLAANITALLAGPAANLFFDEKGAAIPNDWHEVLTGSQADGTQFVDRTCVNWTSNDADEDAQVGIFNDADRTQWLSSHEVGCSQAVLTASGSQGRLYCFATQ